MLFRSIFLFLTLANLGFPPTLNFISEFLILSGVMELNLFTGFLSSIGIFFAGISGFWVFTRVFFGNFAITEGHYNIRFFYDLTRREAYSFFPLIILTALVGLQPNIFLNLAYFNLTAWGY